MKLQSKQRRTIWILLFLNALVFTALLAAQYIVIVVVQAGLLQH